MQYFLILYCGPLLAPIAVLPPSSALSTDSVAGMIASSLFNPQLPDAIPFAPPTKTQTTPIELIASSNCSTSADNLHKLSAANDFETSNIAKSVQMQYVQEHAFFSGRFYFQAKKHDCSYTCFLSERSEAYSHKDTSK